MNYYHMLSDYSIIGTETPIDDDRQLIFGKSILSWNCHDLAHVKEVAMEYRLMVLEGSLSLTTDR